MPKLSTFKDFFFLKIKEIAKYESVKHVHTELVGQDNEKQTLQEKTKKQKQKL